MNMRVLNLLVLFLISTSMFAQRYGGSTPAKQASARYLENIPTGTILYEGFENVNRPGLPLGWSTASNDSIGFVTGTAGDGLGQTNENGFWPVPFNGLFALTNDDVCNCDKSDDQLLSPTFDASGFEQLYLSFEAFQNGSAGQIASVEATAEGLPWINVFNIPARSQWESYSISLPVEVAGAGFQFRFRFNDQGNYAAGLAIDNVLLTDERVESIAIVQGKLNRTDQGSEQVHAQIPLTVARAIRWQPEVVVENEGNQVKNARLEASLDGPVNQDLSSTSWRTAPDETKSLISAPSEVLTPHLMGDYTTTLTISTDSMDVNGQDNSVEQQFSVSDSIYRWSNGDASDNLGAWIQSTGDRLGCSYTFPKPTTLSAINLSIHPTTQVGARFQVLVFAYDTLSNASFSSEAYVVTEDDIGSTVRVPLNAPVTEGRKLIVIEKGSGASRLVVGLNDDRSARSGNALSKRFSGDWLDAPYFIAAELTVATPPQPCSAYSLLDVVPPSCFGDTNGSITVNMEGNAGAVDYAWSNGGGNTNQISNLGSGVYSVTITDVNACTYEETIELDLPDLYFLNPIIGSDECATGIGSIDLNIQGGTAPFITLWDGDTLGERRSMLSAGMYNVEVIDLNGCALNQNINVPGSTPLSLSFNTILPNCGDTNGQIEVLPVGTGPFQYSWSTGDAESIVDTLAAGLYEVTVTDSVGCSLIEYVALNNQNAPTIALNDLQDVACSGEATGSIEVAVGGGVQPYSYTWSNGKADPNNDSLSTGEYTLTVTDQLGCLAFDAYTISTPTVPLIADLNDRGNYCNGGDEGLLEAMVRGGQSPYSYAWSTGSTNTSIGDLEAGPYGLTVTDDNGCSTVVFAEVSNGPFFTLLLDSLQEDTSTSILINGAIYMSTLGGTPPYSYLWNDSIPSEDLLNAMNGDYVLEAQDQLGCVVSTEITLGIGPAGLQEYAEEMNRNLVLYPNPVERNGRITIRSNTRFTHYRLRDTQGRIVQNGDFRGDRDILLDLPSAGLYQVEFMHSLNGDHQAAKVIVR